MIDYNSAPDHYQQIANSQIAVFFSDTEENVDKETIESFGEEWLKFNTFDEEDITIAGNQYFDIVSDKILNHESRILDIGCGTGRWSKFIARKVKFIEAIDPSDAVYAAHKFTRGIDNIRITRAGVDNIPFPDNSFDFVFSLGVLHHVPDTANAIQKAVRKVKPGGHFLIYLYYSLDNRSPLFKIIFYLSNLLRKGVSALPKSIKLPLCDLLAYLIYLPLIGFAKLIKLLSPANSTLYKKIPLSYYMDKSILIIRNDSLDRFGTPLEQRFSREEIKTMLSNAGLSQIVFSENEPYWHAIGTKS